MKAPPKHTRRVVANTFARIHDTTLGSDEIQQELQISIKISIKGEWCSIGQ